MSKDNKIEAEEEATALNVFVGKLPLLLCALCFVD
jgi:hypothetical protein